MAKDHGFDGAVRVAGTDLIGEIQSWNLDTKANVTKGYSMGQAWEDAQSTVKSWSGSVECRFDAADAGQIQLEVGDEVALDFYPGGNTTGKHVKSGSAIITGTPLSVSKDAWVTVTFNFEGNGALSGGTVT